MKTTIVKPHQVPGFNIEHIPDDIADTIWPKLVINGGNCISVEINSPFGIWAKKQGVKFAIQDRRMGWTWIVVWR